MIYQWREGSRYRVDPQVVGETVAALAEGLGGVCPPNAVVEEARNPGSPLHPVVFRLDSGQAAEAWYRQEARQLVNDLTVVIEGSAVRPAAFLSVTIFTSEGPRVGYATRDVVMSNEGMKTEVMTEALAALNGWRRRYRHLIELGPVFDAIDGLGVEV